MSRLTRHYRHKNLAKVEVLVENMLLSHKHTRNCDTALIERVRTRALVAQGLVAEECSHSEYLEAAEQALLPAAATILKWRRWFQRQGRYLPTDKAVAQRRDNAAKAAEKRHGGVR